MTEQIKPFPLMDDAMINSLSRLTATLVLAAAPAVLALQPSYAANHYRIDPASHIGFHVGQAGDGAGISGTFPEVSGSFDIDRNDLAHSSVAVTLRAGSITTGQGRIDTFLRSNAVFDATNHPEITFRSTRVVPTGPKSATIEGILTARGQSRKEAFQATLVDEGGARMAFHVTGDIFRMPYGMGIGVPIYSNVVTFDMQLQGRR
nr:YceI family protein [Xaviernesmea rhizosphaerae]